MKQQLTANKHFKTFKWISKRYKFWQIQNKNNDFFLYNNEIIPLIDGYESINTKNNYFNEDIPSPEQFKEMRQYLMNWFDKMLIEHLGSKFTALYKDKKFEIC